MALEIRSIKGTQDVLPSDTYKWQFVERLHPLRRRHH